jgi:cyclopropane-fatty-acyl-phospholipid synthase
LQIKPKDHILEIGCGWGGLSCYLAQNFDCKITAITLSREQFKHTRELIREKKLDEKIDLKFLDYRNISGQFDKIVSIEMLEAVGDRYLESFFSQCHNRLKKNGLLVMQYITCPDARFSALKSNVDWIQKHIFPGSLLTSVGRVNVALLRTGDLFLHHLEDFGTSYALTLSQWRKNFNQNLDAVKRLGFSDNFIRKWNYYFSC